MKYYFGVIFLAVVVSSELIRLNVVDPLNKSLNERTLIDNGRITNGEIAEEKQFPYQVGLTLKRSAGSFWCGGTIISNRWILTAAHCVDSSISIDVLFGVVNRTGASPGRQVISVDSSKYVHIHEGWDSPTISNDIALIKLPAAISFNEYVQPAKLPEWREDGNYSSYEEDTVIASGWGKDKDTATSVSPVLRFIEVPVYNNKDCATYYSSGSVKSSNICIQTKPDYKSTCNGDSGGPLVLADGSWTVVGATSFGISLGCEVGWPGVFTRVTSYLNWILAITGPL